MTTVHARMDRASLVDHVLRGLDSDGGSREEGRQPVAGWFEALARRASSTGFAELEDAATLAQAAVSAAAADGDLIRHARDVVVFVCQNERRRASGQVPTDVAPVLDAFRERLHFARRAPADAGEAVRCL